MRYTEDGKRTEVCDAAVGVVVRAEAWSDVGYILADSEFNAIVEAGMRRMVLRDEDHAAAMMGRAILWARAQKDTP